MHYQPHEMEGSYSQTLKSHQLIQHVAFTMAVLLSAAALTVAQTVGVAFWTRWGT